MATTKISVTIDSGTLNDVKRLIGDRMPLSTVVDEALRAQLHRLRMLSLLDEMEKGNPLSSRGRAEGEKLWQVINSSSTPERSARSRKKASR